jgi:hypothetical protein
MLLPKLSGLSAFFSTTTLSVAISAAATEFHLYYQQVILTSSLCILA